MPTESPVEYLTHEEVAALLRMSSGGLYNWRVAGKGPPYLKPPGQKRVLYVRSDVIAYLESGRSQSTAEGAQR